MFVFTYVQYAISVRVNLIRNPFQCSIFIFMDCVTPSSDVVVCHDLSVQCVCGNVDHSYPSCNTEDDIKLSYCTEISLNKASTPNLDRTTNIQHHMIA